MSEATTEAQFFGHVAATAPCYVTLAWQVGHEAVDGTHQVAGVVMAVSMANTVTASARSDGEITVTFTEDSVGADRPAAELAAAEQLVATTAQRLRSFTEVDPDQHGVDLDVAMTVDPDTGVGSGAANAAATLVACAALWDLGLSRHELADLGREVSQDVAVSVMGGSAVVSDQGQTLSPILTRSTLHAVVAVTSSPIGGERLGQFLDRLRDEGSVEERSELGVDPEMVNAVVRGDGEVLALMAENDLMLPTTVLSPEVGELIEMGMSEGALSGMVTGEGPAIVFIARDAEEAMHLAHRIEQSSGVSAVPVHGPVPGARIL